MRVSVIGAGAIGGWLASGLIRAGASVTVLARGATLKALAADGLKLDEGSGPQAYPVTVTDRPEDLGGADLLVLGVKAHDLPALAPAIRQALGPEAMVLPAVNGLPWWFFEGFGGPAQGVTLEAVDPGGALARLMPANRVIGAVVHAASRVEATGHIRLLAADKVWLGAAAADGAGKASRVAALLKAGGIPAEATGQIHREVFSKLWGNSNMNPLTALARANAAQLLDDEGARLLVIAMMQEMAELGACIGLGGFDDPLPRIAKTRQLGAFRTSMLQDIEAGRPVELGPIVGGLVELARHLNVPAPTMTGVHGLMRLLDLNNRQT